MSDIITYITTYMVGQKKYEGNNEDVSHFLSSADPFVGKSYQLFAPERFVWGHFEDREGQGPNFAPNKKIPMAYQDKPFLLNAYGEEMENGYLKVVQKYILEEAQLLEIECLGKAHRDSGLSLMRLFNHNIFFQHP